MSDEPTQIIVGDAVVASTEEYPGTRKGRWSRRKRLRKGSFSLTQCENCNAQLRGPYCSVCGQPAIDYRRSFRHVITDLLDSFLNWDSKFFATIALLITRPWRLTNQFLAGRRIRYLHPARLYLLASILFFFAVTYWAKSIQVNPVNLSAEQRADIRDKLKREDVPPEARAKVEQLLDGAILSPERRAEMEAELKREDLPKEERARVEQTLKGDNLPPEAGAKMEQAMKELSPEVRNTVERALKEASDRDGEPKALFQVGKDSKVPPNSFERWIETRAKQKLGEHGTNLQLFLVTLISNLPYMMLACIPLFAFVLKILYLRRRIFYIDHLVYALHIHTFAYLAIMLIVLATIGLNRTTLGPLAGWIIGALWLIFAIQIFLSIRRVYRQGWFFTVFKFFVGGLAYLIVLFVALMTTFFITLALP
jgi:uncharacterized protein DUF3667